MVNEGSKDFHSRARPKEQETEVKGRKKYYFCIKFLFGCIPDPDFEPMNLLFGASRAN